jgi:large subunit ribosomal protein L32
MAVPRNRLSNSRKNTKRSHHAKKPIQMAKCRNCGSACLPHVICANCGAYGKRMVIEKATTQGS